MTWNEITGIDPGELQINHCLQNGQAFRWRRRSGMGEGACWTGVLDDTLVSLKQQEDRLLYKVHAMYEEEACPVMKRDKGIMPYHEALLRDYFQLDTCLKPLYDMWAKTDDNFGAKAKHLKHGVRVLRQDPVENLFTFICSSNNNIARITLMMERLCETYGEVIGVVDDQTYYTFPRIAALACDGVEAKLRELGFGYRAKFIHGAARWCCASATFTTHLNDPSNRASATFTTHLDDPSLIRSLVTTMDQARRLVPYQRRLDPHALSLYALRDVTYDATIAYLRECPGIGHKVADCVALMSLDKKGAIPVDTHIWQIAKRDYRVPGLNKTKSLTDGTYQAIGDFFRHLHGPYAGWAQTLLFTADLKKFAATAAPPKKRLVTSSPRKKKAVPSPVIIAVSERTRSAKKRKSE